jgi:hypothetical protein
MVQSTMVNGKWSLIAQHRAVGAIIETGDQTVKNFAAKI